MAWIEASADRAVQVGTVHRSRPGSLETGGGIRAVPCSTSWADVQVVRLFAWIHDSQRREECREPEHGPRAAEYAREWCGRAFQLRPEQLELLVEACRDHELEQTTRQPTIAVCWDSDRLDLDRVGMTPDPAYFSTPLGRRLASMRPNERRRLVGSR